MAITHAKVSAIEDGADETLVRPSDWNAAHIGETLEFFIPATNGTDPGLTGYHTGYLIDGAGDIAIMEFQVPADYSSITNAEVIGIALAGDGTATMKMQGNTNYGAIDEAYNNHAESDAALVTSVNANTNDLVNWDVSSMLSSLAAGDHVGLRAIYSGTALASNARILGLRLKYS